MATVRKLFCTSQTPFNWREAQAPTFEGVLDRDVVRADITLPLPFVSAAPSALEIAVAHATLETGEAGVDIVAAADPHMITIHATALPPAVRKPTDLMEIVSVVSGIYVQHIFAATNGKVGNRVLALTIKYH